jgi:hypothetical protein
MSSETEMPRSLREMELEVEVEGREWMRHRLEEKLQAEANRHGGVFPPERAQGVASAAAADAPTQRVRHRRAGGVARARPG